MISEKVDEMTMAVHLMEDELRQARNRCIQAIHVFFYFKSLIVIDVCLSQDSRVCRK